MHERRVGGNADGLARLSHHPIADDGDPVAIGTIAGAFSGASGRWIGSALLGQG